MSCLRQYPFVMKMWLLNNHDHLTSSMKCPKAHLGGWHFEMESHWWQDQLVSSLLNPSTGEARMHARGGRTWNYLEFSRLASHMRKEHLQETRRLRLKVCDFREKWPIVQRIPTFQSVSWTANLSWFSKVRISPDCVCHILSFTHAICCNDVVAKSPIWLVLLLHRVVKARSWIVQFNSLPLLWTHLCRQGYSLRELSITISTQLPSPAPTGHHDIFVLPDPNHHQVLLSPTSKVSPCVRLVPFQSPKLRLPSLLHCLNRPPAPTWAPCFPWVLSNELSLQLPWPIKTIHLSLLLSTLNLSVAPSMIWIS